MMGINTIKIYNAFKSRYKPFGTKGIVFIHIPKCGGTSITHGMKSKSHFSNFDLNANASIDAAKIYHEIDDHLKHFNKVHDIRKILLLYEINKNTQFISGHFKFDSQTYDVSKDRYEYLSVLREPVDRFISKYYFNNIDMPLNEFLYTDRAKKWGEEYIDIFLGSEKLVDLSIDEKVEIALENVEKFKIIGKLEDLSAFTTQFRNVFNKKIRIGKLNKGKNRNEVTQKYYEKIKDICSPDIQLYNSV